MSHPAGPPGPPGPWHPQQPYPQQSYPPQLYPEQPYGQPPAAMWPTGAVTVTRHAFDHSKHIMWTILTLGLWGFFGYLPAWMWNRFGPEKSVSVTRFH